jgi:tRNA1Val (adenine37-N6)-methyltransferase
MTNKNILTNNLTIHQSKHDHRFSLDSLILAQNIFPKKKCRILELGCGCGIISIMIARKFPDAHIIGIDILKTAVDIARQNVRINGVSDRVTILERDLRTLKGDSFERFQYIVCNPPFRKEKSGRPNVTYEKLIAREEIACTLNEILAISRKLLVDRGELSLIYPVGRIAELMVQMCSFKITPTDLIPVYTKQNHPAKWSVVKGRLNSRNELRIHAPLYPT